MLIARLLVVTSILSGGLKLPASPRGPPSV
jgi:hypothetical protein